jgi:hypothetical protein
MACCGSGGSPSAQAAQAQEAVAQAASHEVALRYQFGMVGEFFYGAASGIAYRVPSSHVIFADPRDVAWFLELHKHGKPLFALELPAESEDAPVDLEGTAATIEEPDQTSQGEGASPEPLAALAAESEDAPEENSAEANYEGEADAELGDTDAPEDSTPDAPQQSEQTRPGRKPKAQPKSK